MTASTIMIVLRQVEGPRWCVVRRVLRDGRSHFLDRLATARPYPAAVRVAVESAKRTGLVLAIHADGKRPRRFHPMSDLPENGGGR